MAIKVFGPDACLSAAIDANQATTQEGALVLLRSGDIVATFAPGFWSFWTKEEEPDNRSRISPEDAIALQEAVSQNAQATRHPLDA